MNCSARRHAPQTAVYIDVKKRIRVSHPDEKKGGRHLLSEVAAIEKKSISDFLGLLGCHFRGTKTGSENNYHCCCPSFAFLRDGYQVAVEFHCLHAADSLQKGNGQRRLARPGQARPSAVSHKKAVYTAYAQGN